MTKSPVSSTRLDVVRGVQVALRVRGVLEQLAVVVAIALGRLDLRRRLEVQQPLLGALVRVQSPGRADGQDEVVARPVAQRPEDRVAHAGALVDEQHLVGDAVAVERALRHRAGRADDAEHDVVVEVQRDAAGDDVAGDRHVAGLGQAMPMEVVVGGLEPDPRDRLDAVRPRRRGQVVQQRRAAAEALDTEQLLGVQAAVGGAMLGVPLAGDAAVGDVVHRTTGLLGRKKASLEVTVVRCPIRQVVPSGRCRRSLGQGRSSPSRPGRPGGCRSRPGAS